MRGDPQRGFTLLETMVVLLIVGVAMGAAGVSAFGDAQMRTLRQDAQRLAGLFMTAQTEARAVGVRIAWRPGERGFAFERLPRPLVLPARVAARSSRMQDQRFAADAPLRPRAWLSDGPVSVDIRPGGALVFDGDWIHGPLDVTLSAGGRVVRLSRSGNGHYEVRP
ncbi:MAG: prepilin-type N-terminal cleavage/methylation domain-containing protein [Castellaniella sp.]|uniref:Prepilin-type N-terminal cleavage/methylation domain-containing protein n=2 Tax=Castellaniella TaxID=359336 RepID=A0ABV8S201_9BURK